MKACDVMSTRVIAVQPETPARSVAETLMKHGISAVPVVSADGAPLGIISESDLMPRDVSEREARHESWLRMLSQGQDVGPEYLDLLTEDDRSAREIMSAPAVTIDADAELLQIADLLSAKRIKRLPVMRDGKLAGIVSRADLVRAVVQAEADTALARAEVHVDGSEWPVASAKLQALTQPPATEPTLEVLDDGLSAASFHSLVTHHEQELASQREKDRQRTEQKQHSDAQEFLAKRLSEEAWQQMLTNARSAALRGEEESLMLRFPGEVCSDHGRAINAPDPAWPETLRGMASEVFLRWRSELHPQGFVLRARVVEFPGGIPGDIGLFLAW